MTKTLLAALAFGMAAATGAGTITARAQDRLEAGNQGYRGGYSLFGGYYDTFGGYGGKSGYSGYTRSPGSYSPAATFLSIPLYGPPASVSAGAATVTNNDCSTLRRRAQETGSRTWKARYDACRRGG